MANFLTSLGYATPGDMGSGLSDLIKMKTLEEMGAVREQQQQLRQMQMQALAQKAAEQEQVRGILSGLPVARVEPGIPTAPADQIRAEQQNGGYIPAVQRQRATPILSHERYQLAANELMNRGFVEPALQFQKEANAEKKAIVDKKVATANMLLEQMMRNGVPEERVQAAYDRFSGDPDIGHLFPQGMQVGSKQTPDRLTGAVGQFREYQNMTPADQAAFRDFQKETSLATRITVNQPTDSQVETLARGIVDGTINPDAIAKRGGLQGAVFERVKQIDPKFDIVSAGAQAKFQQNVGIQKSLDILDSITPLLGELKTTHANLGFGSYPLLNKAKRTYLEQTGDPRVTAYDNLRNNIILEVTNAMQGSSQMSDARVRMEQENLQKAASPAQMEAAVENIRKIIGARSEAFSKNTRGRQSYLEGNNPYQDLVSRYFPPNAIPEALSVMRKESSNNPSATNNKNANGTRDGGLFQINDVNVPDLIKAGIFTSPNDRLNPEKNVQAAAYLYNRYGWKPWKATASPEALRGGSQGRTVVKKYVSPSTGKTKFVYSDGTEEIR